MRLLSKIASALSLVSEFIGIIVPIYEMVAIETAVMSLSYLKDNFKSENEQGDSNNTFVAGVKAC